MLHRLCVCLDWKSKVSVSMFSCWQISPKLSRCRQWSHSSTGTLYPNKVKIFWHFNYTAPHTVMSADIIRCQLKTTIKWSRGCLRFFYTVKTIICTWGNSKCPFSTYFFLFRWKYAQVNWNDTEPILWLITLFDFIEILSKRVCRGVRGIFLKCANLEEMLCHTDKTLNMK